MQHATTKYISASVGFFDNKVIVPLVCRFYKDDIKNWNDIYGRSDSSLPWDAMNAPVAMPAVTNLVSAEGNSTSLQNAAKGKVGSSRRQLRLTEEDDSNDGTHWDAIRKQKSLTVSLVMRFSDVSVGMCKECMLCVFVLNRKLLLW